MGWFVNILYTGQFPLRIPPLKFPPLPCSPPSLAPFPSPNPSSPRFLPPLFPSGCPGLVPSLPRSFPPSTVPPLAPFLPPSILPRFFPAPLPACRRPTQCKPCVVVGELHWVYCISPSHAWQWDNGVAAPVAGIVSMARCYLKRTCSHHESVFDRVKKSDDRHVQRTLQKHGRRSCLFVDIGGDSQSLLEREPTRSKDRGLLSYNIQCVDIK